MNDVSVDDFPTEHIACLTQPSEKTNAAVWSVPLLSYGLICFAAFLTGMFCHFNRKSVRVTLKVLIIGTGT